MKKITIILTLVLCLSLAGCIFDGTPDSGTAAEPTAESLQETETAAPSEETTKVPETTAEPAPETTAEPEKDVEITMDNWEQYFEVRTAADPYVNENGETEDWSFGCGIFLRPEYVSRFESGEVNFEISYATEGRLFSVDPESGRCILGGRTESGIRPESGCKTVGLEDLRSDESLPETSDFYGSIAARIYCGSAEEGQAATVPGQEKILHAEGMLHFK